jgi:D-alanyl-D-alanine carboxypeptidase/D-alanyl-D-alanine-endopeptidase (penicillin-binding protein 4)
VPPPSGAEATQHIPVFRDTPRRPSQADMQSTQFIPPVRDDDTRAMPRRVGPLRIGPTEPRPPAGPNQRTDTRRPGPPPTPARGLPSQSAPPPTDYDSGYHTGTHTGADYDSDYADEQSAPRPSRSRRGGKPLLISLGVLLGVLVVVAGLLIGSPGVRRAVGLSGSSATETEGAPSPVNFSQLLAPATGGQSGAPTASGVNAQLSALAANPQLGTFTGTVLDASTGTVLYDRNSSNAQLPASTNKVLTSAAALLSLDPQSTLDTTVVAGSDPGTVVLVGGGDPTLNSLSAPQDSVYPGSARLDDLVAQVKKAHPGAISRIVIDTSAYSGPVYGPGWAQSPPYDDYTQMVSAMMDGGRLSPASMSNLGDTPRTQAPAQALGSAFASRLGVSASAVTVGGTAPSGAQVLGTVHSAPLEDLVTNLLQISDNLLAEALGRAVAKADNQPESFQGATTAVKDVLQRNGFDISGLSLSDSSGLSTQDSVPARLLAQVLRVAANPDGSSDPRVARLRPLLTGLPVAGGSGTLFDRYLTAPASAGRGWVRAKTGTLSDQNVNTLAGVVLDADGRVLVFALMSGGAAGPTAADTLDGMAAALHGCGCTG